MSARLSPAASLLRNSKLFALPPPIALPPAVPSSDQVSRSDTATSVYPQYAAIETTTVSGSQGDWGFKRPLPLKATKSTANPVVRLVRGIDTPEHVADFESAADHVLTLRKFQEMNQSLRHPQLSNAHNNMNYNVFRASHDNTTNLSSSAPGQAAQNGVWPNVSSKQVFDALPENIKRAKIEIDKQEEVKRAVLEGDKDTSGLAALQATTSYKAPQQTRRWRYAGPSLTQMSGMAFDHYLQHGLGKQQKDMLLDRVKKEVINERVARARDDGKMHEVNTDESAITQEQINDYIRKLRKSPARFGRMITDMLDIPEGAPPPREDSMKENWDYGRDTLASPHYKLRGPPRTHPSAGLSYVHTENHIVNHPTFGPLQEKNAVLARAVRTKTKIAGGTDIDWGVAGFVVPDPDKGNAMSKNEAYRPVPGGVKLPLRPVSASIDEKGILELKTRRVTEWKVEDDRAMLTQEWEHSLREKQIAEAQAAAMRNANSVSRLSRSSYMDEAQAPNNPALQLQVQPDPSENMSEEDKLLGMLARGPYT